MKLHQDVTGYLLDHNDGMHFSHTRPLEYESLVESIFDNGNDNDNDLGNSTVPQTTLPQTPQTLMPQSTLPQRAETLTPPQRAETLTPPQRAETLTRGYPTADSQRKQQVEEQGQADAHGTNGGKKKSIWDCGDLDSGNGVDSGDADSGNGVLGYLRCNVSLAETMDLEVLARLFEDKARTTWNLLAWGGQDWPFNPFSTPIAPDEVDRAKQDACKQEAHKPPRKQAHKQAPRSASTSATTPLKTGSTDLKTHSHVSMSHSSSVSHTDMSHSDMSHSAATPHSDMSHSTATPSKVQGDGGGGGVTSASERRRCANAGWGTTAEVVDDAEFEYGSDGMLDRWRGMDDSHICHLLALAPPPPTHTHIEGKYQGSGEQARRERARSQEAQRRIGNAYVSHLASLAQRLADEDHVSGT